MTKKVFTIKLGENSDIDWYDIREMMWNLTDETGEHFEVYESVEEESK